VGSGRLTLGAPPWPALRKNPSFGFATDDEERRKVVRMVAQHRRGAAAGAVAPSAHALPEPVAQHLRGKQGMKDGRDR